MTALQNSSALKKPLLIFDLDGTLIDSAPDLADSVNAMLTTLGQPNFSESTIRNWVGNGATKLVERALLACQNAVDKAEIEPAQLNHAVELFFNSYASNSCVRTVPYAGVSEGLIGLKHAGYTLTLVTNKPTQFIRPILDTLGWQALFTMTLGGDSLPVKKPDPAPLLQVCTSLGVGVAQSYMIGDSKNDMLAGKNAGMDTLGLSYGYNYGEDIREQQPSQVFDKFSDLVNFLLK